MCKLLETWRFNTLLCCQKVHVCIFAVRVIIIFQHRGKSTFAFSLSESSSFFNTGESPRLHFRCPSHHHFSTQGDHPCIVCDGPTKRPQYMRISRMITVTYLFLLWHEAKPRTSIRRSLTCFHDDDLFSN